MKYTDDYIESWNPRRSPCFPPVRQSKWRIVGRLLIDLVKLVIWKIDKLLGGYR
jgi:hypothetical protein